MKKTLLAALALALSIAGCGTALAEVRQTELFADSDHGSWYFFAESDSINHYGENGYSIYGVDGELVSQERYQRLGNVDYGYSSVENDKGINVKALMNADGMRVSDYCYGVLVGETDRWAYGVVIEECSKGDAIYKDGDGGYYSPIYIDIFYNGNVVARLDGSEYNGGLVYGFGSYIMVETDADHGVYACFDKNGNRFEFDSNEKDKAHWDVVEGTYKVDGAVYHISGAPMYVAECPLALDDVVMPYAVSDDSMSIVDLQGNVVCTPGIAMFDLERYDSVSNLVSVSAMSGTGQRKTGLVDLSTGKVVLPPEYDSIGDGNSLATYGYTLLKADGKYGFATTEGTITVEPKYPSTVARNNLWVAVQDMNGSYYVVSAKNGFLDESYDSIKPIYGSKASPFVCLYDANDKCGVIDYQGDIVLPFEYEGWQVHVSNGNRDLLLVENEDSGNPAMLYSYVDESSSEEILAESIDKEASALPDAEPEEPNMAQKPSAPESVGTELPGSVDKDKIRMMADAVSSFIGSARSAGSGDSGFVSEGGSL